MGKVQWLFKNGYLDFAILQKVFSDLRIYEFQNMLSLKRFSIKKKFMPKSITFEICSNADY